MNTKIISFVDNPDFWEISIKGRQITRCCLDYALTIDLWDLDDSLTVKFENPFKLISANKNYEVNPQNPKSIEPMLQLLFEEVLTLKISKSGKLEMSFVNGSYLWTDPHEEYEAWELNSSKGLKFVCMPGGEVAIWESDKKT